MSSGAKHWPAFPFARSMLLALACLLFAGPVAMAGSAALAQQVGQSVPVPRGVHLPMRVHLAMRILNVSKIDEPLREASLVVEVTQRWKDPGQAFDARATGVGRRDYIGVDAEALLSTIWTPGVIIENQISVPRSQTTSMSIRADGTVTLINRLDADFRVAIDMSTFPFDRQRLQLSVVSPRYSADEVIFVMTDLDRELSSVAETLSASNWTARSMRFVMERFHGWNARPFVRVIASAVVDREWSYYLLRIFIPFAAVMSVSVFILWAPEKLLGDKVPLTFSALMALAALSFTYEASFPGSISMNSPIAFMTSIGYLYLTGVLLVNILLVYAPVAIRDRYPHLETEIRRNIRYTIPAVFLLTCVCSVLRSMV
ncbi:neurotransmitter-gated ion-channel ligand-binding protein [Agrobacterium sp. a22-2]|uniref:neurotransmitter-gated ion-channel ligand-binding protein n=1 Tax=Agrobacterium sp. a22-2 TaxID=2283840 RepID=UPI0014477F44|nr:neurotransmitter-gated ion-channel ligand-binding protein [Agrobacterium sp. a22-2]NKN39645.1 neurotransmitter-gated ion-channel ligand-binding protein [Agrobacterium sp. a22-2]